MVQLKFNLNAVVSKKNSKIRFLKGLEFKLWTTKSITVLQMACYRFNIYASSWISLHL